VKALSPKSPLPQPTIPSSLTIAPAREAVGLAYPMRADRLAIWSMVKVPSAGIEDGYVPLKPAETIQHG